MTVPGGGADSAYDPAPELRVPYWIDAEGRERPPLRLSELGPGFKLIYCFQHWCEGCHSHGFPTLQRLVSTLSSRGFGFAVVQTVFEGEAENTPDKLRLTQERYGLRLPFGHDVAEPGSPLPGLMRDYRTGGTPWFLLIDPAGDLIFSNFHLDADMLFEALGVEVR
jgi:hypothetical protein